MRNRALCLALLPLALLTCEIEPPEVEAEPGCGDGQIVAPEQCDDANTKDGDGCSAACEMEPITANCVDLIETEAAIPAGFLALPDGRVLLSGQITNAESTLHGWLGAFDSDGTQLWSLDLGEDTIVFSIIRRGQGFAAISRTWPYTTIIEFDETGALTGSIHLSELEGEGGTPETILDTSSGLLLGGVRGENLWLSRLGTGGTLETILNEDYAGFEDYVVGLVRHGDQIGMLANVGVGKHNDEFMLKSLIEDTLLFIYDEQMTEISRTVVSSDDDRVSLVGGALAVTNDGTWIIAGKKELPEEYFVGSVGWVAAVRGGEVAWTLEPLGAGANTVGYPMGLFNGASIVHDEVLVTGSLGTPDGVRRWAMHLSHDDGSVYSELLGPPTGGYDSYKGASSSGDGQVWVSGLTRKSESASQWLCSMGL